MQYVLCICLGLSFCLSSCSGVFASEAASVEVLSSEKPLVDMFQSAKDAVLDLYPQDVSLDDLYEGAIRGLFDSLGDPYSEYLNQEEFDAYTQEVEGEFSGIGVSIQLVQGNVTVVSVFQGSPAEKAGMKPGDVIVEVDGVDLRNKTLQEASSLLRGEAGTTVKVTVVRPSAGETITLNIVRAKISIKTIDMQDLGDGKFYVRISQFTSNTGKNFSFLMKWMRDRGLNGLILDLRGNPGGVLGSAVEVAGELVPKGPIVKLKGKVVNQTVWNPKDGEPVPTIILIDGGSASASEIVAGAVKDRGRAILVGETTYGKACVQIILPLGDNMGGIKLTIADYYTPSGAMISGVGLSPNIPIQQEPLTLPDPVTFKRVMKPGCVGLDVLSLQDCLEFLGYNPGPLDGIFGPKTETAVASYLKDQGRKYKGYVGETEVLAVNGSVSEKATNPPDQVLEKAKILLDHWLEMYW